MEEALQAAAPLDWGPRTFEPRAPRLSQQAPGAQALCLSRFRGARLNASSCQPGLAGAASGSGL